MICPDWQTLCDRRQAGPGDGPGWQAAVRHLDGCERCQRTALAADPTLLFRRLPALTASDDEKEAMKRAVANRRRSETFERRASRRRLPARRRLLLRAAALAAVLLGSILMRGAQPPLPAESAPQATESPAVGAAAALAQELEWLPLVETVDPSYGPFIQLVDDEILAVGVLPSNVGGEQGADLEAAYPDA